MKISIQEEDQPKKKKHQLQLEFHLVKFIILLKEINQDIVEDVMEKFFLFKKKDMKNFVLLMLKISNLFKK